MEAGRDTGEQQTTRRAISRSIVALMKEHLDRGPVRAKSYIHDDSVLVLMFEGHTHAEEKLAESGEANSVARQRVRSATAISEQLRAVVEAEVGRKVIGFMSSSQQHPSLLSLVFVLETTDLMDADAG